MRYLFYDLEFASQLHGKSKICEFGYVVTNENFEIIDEGNFIIDPNIPFYEWDRYVLSHLLNRKKSIYLKSPLFEAYYNKIKNLIASADYVFGHSLNGDAKALNDELERYKLDAINYDFYDVKNFYKQYSNINRDVSVTDILKKLNIDGDDRAHDAQVDSYNVMLELKKMKDDLEVSLEELIMLCDASPDRSYDYKVESIEKNKQLWVEQSKRISDDSNLIKKHGLNRRRFLQFLDNVKKNSEGHDLLKGKNITISLNYESEHYKQMLNLIQLIVNEGGNYILKGSLSNMYVKYDEVLNDGTLRYCSRLKYVNEEISKGAQIEIIDFHRFLEILGITEEELNQMEFPTFDFLNEPDAIIKSNKDNRKSGKSKKDLLSYTFEDALKEKNIDYKKYLDDSEN